MRLRWFREHASNRNNTGPLRNTSFLEEAPLATWNPRAAYATRSPWDLSPIPLGRCPRTYT